jgi:hypothetical protein
VARGRDMGGRDEMARIEAFGLPGSRKGPRTTKRVRKDRGVPQPATFDIVSDSNCLGGSHHYCSMRT